MRVCENLEPGKVFYFFEEISGIPHGSGNTKAISDYLVSFAKDRNLFYTQDEKNNVIIIKEATKGYEEAEPVILQGHIDMVCEKDSDTEFDFRKDSLNLYIDGDYLRARGTTLGGDDGIAVAYSLAILDDDTISHPRLEVVLTSDEEVGMLGAQDIDLSILQGKRMLNLDFDEDGNFLTSCAGGMRADVNLPVTCKKESGMQLELVIKGLEGGHSGSDIHKERANAILLLGRFIKYLRDRHEFSLESMKGGLQDNAIPREAICTIVTDSTNASNIQETVQEFYEISKKEYINSDPELTITCLQKEEGTYETLDENSFLRVMFLLNNITNGIAHMSTNIDGLVESSSNVGVMEMTNQSFRILITIRSSVTSRKYELADKLTFLSEFLGAEIKYSGDYPAWEYKENSKLREQITSLYEELFQRKPKVEAVHAGLECGIFAGKIKGLDCISFGPENLDIHTPKERLSISSTLRIYQLIVEYLRRANQ